MAKAGEDKDSEICCMSETGTLNALFKCSSNLRATDY